MVKIYTKTGDRGTTSIFGGTRVEKSSLRISAYGEIDELNSLIGVILADLTDYSSSDPELDEGESRSSRQARTIIGRDELQKKLLRTQSELFVLGSNLATPNDVKIKIPRIAKSYITKLEKEIDAWSKHLPQLKHFILPGGLALGAKLHLSRTVARRAERSIVELASQEKIDKNALVYINRLSDWFFVLARYVNKLENVREEIWKGRS